MHYILCMARGYRHKTSRFTVELDDFFHQARIYSPNSLEREKILKRAYSQHAALAYDIADKMKRFVEFDDVFGFYWEAMVNSVDLWNPEKAKAATFIQSKCIGIIKDYAYWHHTRGSVRVPLRSTKYSGVSIDVHNESILVLTE